MKRNLQEYPFEIHALPEEDGGGMLCTFPDIPGCMGDGETPNDALSDGLLALDSWLKTAQEFDDPIPEPNSASGKFLTRIPKSLHARLISRAKMEGVSLNSLVQTYLAERV